MNSILLEILSYSKKIMIAKKILLMMRRNSMTLLWAALLASWIFYVVNNPNVFTASILSLQEQNFIIEKWRDIAYKTNSGYVDIFMAKTLETPAKIDFTISFDKDTVTIDPNNLSGQGTRTFSNPDANNITIQSIPICEQTDWICGTIDKSKSLIMLPFTGDITDILLSEAVAKMSNGNEKNLSIWSLNEIASHSIPDHEKNLQ